MRRLWTSLCLAVCLAACSSLALAQGTQTPQTVVVTVERANLRDQPTTTAGTVVGSLSRGDRLEVLETIGTWYRIRVPATGQTGYVSNTVVQAAAPVPPGGAPSAPAPRPGTPQPPPPPTTAASAATQAAARARAATAKPKVGFRAHVISEGEQVAAKNSFAAVLDSGTASLSNLGFGVEVTNLWNGVFARFGYTHSSNSGSRVIVDEFGDVFFLGIPLTIDITPMEIGGGWRFAPVNSRGAVTLVPYAGASLLLQRYKETSDFADAAENTDTTDRGQAVFGGVEVGFRAVKFLKIGVEGQYRSVPNAIGAGGASLEFNETNLGGTAFQLKFGVGF